jgi:hypothetical protein
MKSFIALVIGANVGGLAYLIAPIPLLWIIVALLVALLFQAV